MGTQCAILKNKENEREIKFTHNVAQKSDALKWMAAAFKNEIGRQEGVDEASRLTAPNNTQLLSPPKYLPSPILHIPPGNPSAEADDE